MFIVKSYLIFWYLYSSSSLDNILGQFERFLEACLKKREDGLELKKDEERRKEKEDLDSLSEWASQCWDPRSVMFGLEHYHHWNLFCNFSTTYTYSARVKSFYQPHECIRAGAEIEKRC